MSDAEVEGSVEYFYKNDSEEEVCKEYDLTRHDQLERFLTLEALKTLNETSYLITSLQINVLPLFISIEQSKIRR